MPLGPRQVLALADAAAGWAASVRVMLREDPGVRELPELTCPRCRRRRVRELRDDGEVYTVPALRFTSAGLPTIACRGCGHAWRGGGIHRLAGQPGGASRGPAAV